MKSNSIARLTLTAFFAALCYIGFQFLRIDIPLPGGTTAIHFGNAFCVLAALLLGGVQGGLAGAVGMTLADLFNPLYITSAPKTFVLKFMIGLITGYVAYKIAKIHQHEDRQYLLKWSIIASIAGMGFNVIFDPLASFFYKNFILGVESNVAKIFAAWTAGSTFINAITSVIIATILYMALRPSFKKYTK